MPKKKKPTRDTPPLEGYMAYLSITFLIASISARLNATNIYAKAIATAPMTSAAFTLAIHTPQPPYFAVVTAQPAAS